jgi:hypothetical protein
MWCLLKNFIVFLHEGQVDSVYMDTFFIMFSFRARLQGSSEATAMNDVPRLSTHDHQKSRDRFFYAFDSLRFRMRGLGRLC